jgi:hypothetical protein
MKLLEISSMGFDVTDLLLIKSFAFIRYWIKNGSTVTVLQLFIDFKKALLFSQKGTIVQYSHRVCGTHEISQAD